MPKGIITTKIAIFKGKEIRKTIYNNEWWFVVADIVLALTDTPNVKDYIRKMRIRDKELGKGWGQIVTPLSIDTAGGKQELNCANTEGIFRIIQSIPSPKAEPFKRWLARVGYERVKEIEDPELAAKRTRMLYKAKGYSGSYAIQYYDKIIFHLFFPLYQRGLGDFWVELMKKNKSNVFK